MTKDLEEQAHKPALRCPSCKKELAVSYNKQGEVENFPTFCQFCGSYLLKYQKHIESLQAPKSKDKTATSSLIRNEHTSSSEVEDKPNPQDILFEIGRYQVLELAGQGGMGQVFRVYDPLCGRYLALKRIRQNFKNPKSDKKIRLYSQIFLREARICSQLNHPSIMPIHTIHEEEELPYYTMPLIQGDTLSDILRRSAEQEKKGSVVDPIGCSIPSLLRIFLTVCQALAYAHSRGVLHRDIKPNNVMVGKYGHIQLLDWGLAKVKTEADNVAPTMNEDEVEGEDKANQKSRLLGCLPYMSPETIRSGIVTERSEIFCLGVSLYQMLTLQFPFHRLGKSRKDIAKGLAYERFQDPSLFAPNRNIPRALSRICKKCLEKEADKRYESVDALIADIEMYLEGRSDWFPVATLSTTNKDDWEFQENVYLAEDMAITRHAEVTHWVSLMISKPSFSENTMLETRLTLHKGSQGVGFLLSVPESMKRSYPSEGVCIWLGSPQQPCISLFRSTVEILSLPNVFLEEDKEYDIRIENIDNSFHLYVDGVKQLSHASAMGLHGTHIGLVSRDAHFDIDDITVSIGSLNILVNCLAVPDAFLAQGYFKEALEEYLRIARSFPDRAEGLEALFRAGLTHIEEAKQAKSQRKKNQFFELALEEFHKLAQTPNAPLEYLGKSLVYLEQGDYEEEIKCLELAIRKYKNRRLPMALQEQILFRMHDSTRHNRAAAYSLILLVARRLPQVAHLSQTQRLFRRLQKHWEPLKFIESEPLCASDPSTGNRHCGIQLAYMLKRPHILREMVDELAVNRPDAVPTIGNGVFCLIKLGSYQVAEDLMEHFWIHEDENTDEEAEYYYVYTEEDEEEEKERLEKEQEQENKQNEKMQKIKAQLNKRFDLLRCAITAEKEGAEEGIKCFSKACPQPKEVFEKRVLWYLCFQALNDGKENLVIDYSSKLDLTHSSEKDQQRFDGYLIWAYLQQKNWDEAGKLLQKYSIETFQEEGNILHFLYGCWLAATESVEIAQVHFSSVLPTRFPLSWSLFSHYMLENINLESGWIDRAFSWEKRRLFRQLALYYHCIDDKKQSRKFKRLEAKERTAPYDG